MKRSDPLLLGGSGLSPRVLPALGLLLVFGLASCDASPLLFPSPEAVELVGDAGTTAAPLVGVVDEVVAPGPILRVVDAAGNPVPGARVRVAPAPGSAATLEVTEYISDRQGRIVVEGWRLGETTGGYELRGQLLPPGADAPPPTLGPGDLRVLATARPGAPATLEWTPPQGEPSLALVNQLFGDLPPVRVRDRFGNPVPQVQVTFQVLSGGGTPGVTQAFTDNEGTARVLTWRMGPDAGLQELEARVTDAPSVSDTLRATAVLFQVEHVHINQGNQTLNGTIPLVADRPGLLRVFLRGGETTAAGIPVQVRLRRAGTLVLEETFLRGDEGGVPTGPVNPDVLDQNWNLPLPAEAIQPGTEMQLRIQLGETGGPAGGGEEVWPADGGWVPLDVVTVPEFRATYIPVHSTWYGLTGRITPANGPDYWTETLDSFPIGAYDFEVRATPFVYDGSFADANAGWVGILQQIRDLRLVEGAGDRYYHGILQRPSGPGIAGIAYVATQPLGTQNLAAMSYDDMALSPQVIAHEFGHNFGRNHSPCGNVSGVDPAFPHAGGRLGGPGWGVYSGQLRPTSGFRDIMSYCFPLWASDYTFASILAMRLARPVGDLPPGLSAFHTGAPAPEAGGPPGPPRPGLLVGGGWSESEGVVVRPALAVEAPLTPQAPEGDAVLELLDAQGRVLYAHRLQGAVVDHAEDPTLRHVGAVIPAPQGADAVPAAIRLRTPLGTRMLHGSIESPAPAPEGALFLPPGAVRGPGLGEPDPVRATREPGTAAFDGGGGTVTDGWDRVRVEWDAERWPVLLLRDSTGRVQGFLRSGNALVPVAPRVTELDLTISDGVRSRPLPTPVR
jgi:hypothetical protein